MGLACYEIVGNDTEWRVRHDGKAETFMKPRRPPSRRPLPPRLLQFGKATRSGLRRPHVEADQPNN
jgi:hypothetical protein